MGLDTSPPTHQFGVEVVELQRIMESTCREEQAVKGDDNLVEASATSSPYVVKNEYRCCEQHTVRAYGTQQADMSLPRSLKRS